MKKLIISLAVILVLLIAALGAVYIGTELKADTMPTVAAESTDGYATNMVNSLLGGDELEIPDGILTTLVGKGEGIVCHVNSADELELWEQYDIPLLGRSDVCVKLKYMGFDSESGNLSFSIGDISAGSVTLPEFIRPYAMKEIEKKLSSGMSLSGNTLKINIQPFSVSFMHTEIIIGVEAVSIHDGSLWLKLFTNSDFSF